MGIMPTMAVPAMVLTFDDQRGLWAKRTWTGFTQFFAQFFGPGAETTVDAHRDPLADSRDAANVVMTVKNGGAYSLSELVNPDAHAR